VCTSDKALPAPLLAALAISQTCGVPISTSGRQDGRCRCREAIARTALTATDGGFVDSLPTPPWRRRATNERFKRGDMPVSTRAAGYERFATADVVLTLY
jgi:hypothetical protein